MKSEIYISCVDSVKSRFDIAEILNELKIDKGYYRNQCKYWMDFGNSQFTGQVLLSTIGNIKQPNSENMKRWKISFYYRRIWRTFETI
jgi:hypothetical protein